MAMRSVLLVAAVLVGVGEGVDPCAALPNCTACIDHVGCGWCSTDVVYASGAKGSRCAGPKYGEAFTCPSIYSTERCIAGYVCKEGKCQVGEPGTGTTKEQCEATCRAPTPAPTPVQVYGCDRTNFTCRAVRPGTAGAASLEVCERECSNHTSSPSPASPVYVCNGTSLKCEEAKAGTPGAGSEEVCEAGCWRGYACNETAAQCYEVAGWGNRNRTACEEGCQPAPPPGMSGVWRGLFIERGMRRGEVDVAIDGTSISVVAEWGTVLSGRIFGDATRVTVAKEDGGRVEGVLVRMGNGPQTEFVEMGLGGASVDEAMAKGQVLFLARCVNAPLCTFTMLRPGAGAGAGAGALLMEAEGEGPKDPCSAHGASCKECLAADPQCGWCSQAVRYTDGSVGTQCAGVNEGITPFVCLGQYSTDKCLTSYRCDNATWKCVPSSEGGSLDQCQASCKPPAPPTPTPTPHTPAPAAKLYRCNFTTATCEEGGSEGKAQCEGYCVKPRPGPPAELEGRWRGLEIRKGYKVGEYDLTVNGTVATLTAGNTTVWKASVESFGNVYVRFVLTSGDVLLAMYQVTPSVTSEVVALTMAWGMPNGDMPESFNAAMLAPLDEHFFIKCRTDSPLCSF